ncbi:MAG: acyl carrier protein [Spiroplasma poulsonii]|uniref:Acyl carrier protein n=1 Tax=Spiroplasma poulsonii TaxID=2138 RepID=A0A2P6FA55_9MOLU|nr:MULTISPECIES: phosphopantetheine-binding protein [Spiroplasma]KAF0851992.1 Acyl carrier protein [Spiroplasma poulsonii]MBH8622896.1 acyl carrier protein [Spiroplasma sp. hyd1]MBW1241805.1 acyl carrier protein [Spiroplasma poulsonii]PQM30345.1 Acyl carrier protein [Spiroplasma poulsonii]PWF95310.1 Acyl carrier protein [Spiroplasma poulsonii]
MDVLNEVKKVLKEHGVSKQVDLNTEFKSIGLDSLDLMDLVIEAEKKIGIQIPDDKLMDIKTVADLVKIIEEIKK